MAFCSYAIRLLPLNISEEVRKVAYCTLSHKLLTSGWAMSLSELGHSDRNLTIMLCDKLWLNLWLGHLHITANVIRCSEYCTVRPHDGKSGQCCTAPVIGYDQLQVPYICLHLRQQCSLPAYVE